MAKKALLKDHDNIEILPITRGELVLDSSGNPALRSTEFLATTSQPGLMSAEDKYKILNMQASSVANALTLKINNGSTEGTNLYTFNGSAAKTLNIVAGDNITLTPSAGAVSISASIPATIDAYTKTESDNRYLKLSGGTLTGTGILPLNIKSGGSDSEIYSGIKFFTSNNHNIVFGYKYNKGLFVTNEDSWSNEYFIIHSGNISSYLPTIPTVTDYYWADQKITTEAKANTTPTFGSINVIGNATATSFIGNLDGQYVDKLTNYTKATTVAAIATTDSLNTALGKLELKADTAYTLVAGAYDGDGTIENLAEILKVLEGIKDTETIQAIVGKYLPLTGGTIESTQSIPLYIKSGHGTECAIGLSANNTKGYGYLVFKGGDSWAVTKEQWGAEYTLIHSGNVESQIVEGVTTHTNGARNANGDISILNSYYSSKGFRISRFNGLNGLGTKNADGLIVNWPLDYAYGQQWYMDDESHTIQTRYVANGSWSAWKTLAFTDSDITGNAATATKLKTPVTIWGQNFDGTANVRGILTLGNEEFIATCDTNNTPWSALYLSNNNNLLVGYGTSAKGYTTKVQGKEVWFNYGTNHTVGMRINSSGNVTIGESDLASTTHKLYVNGTVRANAFIKSDSSDSYILLGGGSHKLISDFVLSTDFASKELASNLTTITKTLTVTKDWMDTGIKYTDLATGTYAVQVYVHSSADGIWYGTWSGIMSWYGSSTNGSRSDEILLHCAGHAIGPHIYLRTSESLNSAGTSLRLQIAASKTLTSASYTFKFKKLI